MAIIETKILNRTGNGAQPTVTITIESSDNSIRWTDHTGVARQVPFTFTNAAAIARCAVDGGANMFTRYTNYL